MDRPRPRQPRADCAAPGRSSASGTPAESRALPQSGIASARPRTGRGWHRRLPRSACIAIAAVATALLLFVLVLAVDLGSTLAQPSPDGPVVRAAEWARDRNLGDVVSWLEWVSYQFSPPPVGGEPDGGVPVDAGPLPTPSAGGPDGCGRQRLLPPPGAQALPNEGVWQPIQQVRGQPAILAAFVRPDDKHTRFLTGVTCIDQRLVQFRLHPGTEVPGSSGWAEDPTLTSQELPRLLATFNSGFRMPDSYGGFWMQGKSVGHLVAGAASMVFYRDGRLDVRDWEGGTPATDIAAVRQNLTLLVSHGRINSAVQHADSGAFGRTVGDATYVWRSGIGIRPDGSIVTVHGNALSVQTLARLLVNAGADRAMELDINRDWTSYIYYRHTGGGVVPTKLTADEIRPAGRYLQTSTRDFVAVSTR